jgi:hypothetical protein
MFSGEPSDLTKFREKLRPGETVSHYLKGFVGEVMGKGSDRQRNGVLILTNQRIVFYSKSIIFGEIQETVPLDKVSSLDTGRLTVFHFIKIYSSLGGIYFKTGQYREAAEMSERITAASQASRISGSVVSTVPTSKADELKKLADLKASGVLTDEEFQREKDRLLKAA